METGMGWYMAGTCNPPIASATGTALAQLCSPSIPNSSQIHGSQSQETHTVDPKPVIRNSTHQIQQMQAFSATLCASRTKPRSSKSAPNSEIQVLECVESIYNPK